MVAADSEEHSLHRLREFEELFKNRYTEHDQDYKKATQDGERSYTQTTSSQPPNTGACIFLS